MEFNLKRAEEPVTLVSPDGTKNQFTLRELTGQERVAYQNTMAKNVRTDTTGKPVGLKSFDGIETELIAASLYDAAGAKVNIQYIMQFPSKVQQGLFDAARKLSGLDDKAEETAKND